MQGRVKIYEKWTKSFFKWKAVTDILGENYTLTDEQLCRLYRVFEKYGSPRSLQNRLLSVALMIFYDLNNYVGRIRRLKMLPASPTRYSYFLTYGREYYLKKYRETAAKRTKHFQNRINYWVDLGLTQEEAQEKTKDIQIARANLAGDKLRGTSEYTIRSASYWIKHGYSEKSAKEKVGQIQCTFSLEKCIKKYGEDAGKKIWEDRQKSWQETLNNKTPEEKARINLLKSCSIESFLLKGHTQEEAETLSRDIFKNRKNYSIISQKCFDMISEIIGKDCLYYKTLNYERQFFNKCVDFYDAKSNCVVEFYGDFWHRNPKMFNEDVVYYKLSSKEIWSKDENRLNLIRKHVNVSDIIIIWESDFRKNPTKIVKEICDKLLEKRNDVDK